MVSEKSSTEEVGAQVVESPASRSARMLTDQEMVRLREFARSCMAKSELESASEGENEEDL